MTFRVNFMSYIKINSKWVTDLNVKYMTFRGKNTWEKSLRSGVFIFDTGNTNHKRKK